MYKRGAAGGVHRAARGSRTVRPGVLRPAGRSSVRIQAVAEVQKSGSMAPAGADAIKQEIIEKLRDQFGKIEDYHTKDIYRGTAWSAREHLIDSFEKTQEYWE